MAQRNVIRPRTCKLCFAVENTTARGIREHYRSHREQARKEKAQARLDALEPVEAIE